MSDETTNKPTTEDGPPRCAVATCSAIKTGDTVICMIDEWRRGEKQAFDGTVTWKNERGVDVCYLSGYRSRNDFVEWGDVVAKLDMRCKRVTVADGAFEGHFRVFAQPNTK